MSAIDISSRCCGRKRHYKKPDPGTRGRHSDHGHRRALLLDRRLECSASEVWLERGIADHSAHPR
jgi:hypothetical protein